MADVSMSWPGPRTRDCHSELERLPRWRSPPIPAYPSFTGLRVPHSHVRLLLEGAVATKYGRQGESVSKKRGRTWLKSVKFRTPGPGWWIRTSTARTRTLESGSPMFSRRAPRSGQPLRRAGLGWQMRSSLLLTLLTRRGVQDGISHPIPWVQLALGLLFFLVPEVSDSPFTKCCSEPVLCFFLVSPKLFRRAGVKIVEVVCCAFCLFCGNEVIETS
ncbi:hypothetical protein VUR80DRAFT_451 [Thermomyces stellatus]